MYVFILQFKPFLSMQLRALHDVGAARSVDLIREKYVLPILIVSIRIDLERSFPISISQMMLKVLMKISPFEITTVAIHLLLQEH